MPVSDEDTDSVHSESRQQVADPLEPLRETEVRLALSYNVSIITDLMARPLAISAPI